MHPSTKINLYAVGILAIIVFLSAIIPHAGMVFLIVVILLFIYDHYSANESHSSNHIPVDPRTIEPNLAAFMHMKHKYLQSQEWRTKRELTLRRDRHCCRKCYSTSNLDVHHIRYSNIPNEHLDELITLCRSCHQSEHDHYGYPQTYADYMRWNQPLRNKHEKDSYNL